MEVVGDVMCLWNRTRLDRRMDENTVLSKRFFMLCGSCFWSASSFYEDFIVRCPLCSCLNIDVIPICTNETFTLYHHSIRGISIEFRNSNQQEDNI